ncbi:activator-dependent family glycosyltransferase [Streptomyces sp. NPDC059881]|uniref:activator-dependent family glycosyltransferase n=1 Tax=Streptomyces sp. NPDC059881 TaxID=3346986 RepID=UPI0036603BEA
MRVLFTTLAAATHVHTQVPLAWALRAAGHEVRMTSQPDAVEHIRRAGLPAVPVGTPLAHEALVQELDERRADALESGASGPETLDYLALTDISETRPERMSYVDMHAKQLVLAQGAFPAQSDPGMIDDLVRFARWWRPDLVVWDTMTFAGPVAAMASGAAHARLLFGLDLIGWMRRHYRQALASRHPLLRDDPLADWLGWTLDAYDCVFSEEAVVGQWTVDPMPTSLALPVPGPRVPVRYVPYNGPSVVPSWVHERPARPRICVTLGVSQQEVFGAHRASVGEILTAVAELDVEVVATLSETQVASLGVELPQNVRAVGFVPLDALLPSCAVVVSHAGAGTMHTALHHGVPQVLVPDPLWDAARKAERLVAAGAGLAVADPQCFTAAELRSLVQRVLEEPSFAAGTARVRGEMLATPAPADILPTLERLSAEFRR